MKMSSGVLGYVVWQNMTGVSELFTVSIVRALIGFMMEGASIF
jgi:hypothetical protein